MKPSAYHPERTCVKCNRLVYDNPHVCRKPRSPIRKISKKRLSKLGKGPIWSTVKKKPRKKAETLRIYGPPGYVEWCKSQPCVACFDRSGSEVAHIKTGGTGRKDEWTRTVPLCGPHLNGWLIDPGCHRLLHHIGRYAFEDRFSIDLDACASATHTRWLSHTEEN